MPGLRHWNSLQSDEMHAPRAASYFRSSKAMLSSPASPIFVGGRSTSSSSVLESKQTSYVRSFATPVKCVPQRPLQARNTIQRNPRSRAAGIAGTRRDIGDVATARRLSSGLWTGEIRGAHSWQIIKTTALRTARHWPQPPLEPLDVKDERSARQDVLHPIYLGKPPCGNTKNIRPGAARIVSISVDLCPVFNTR